MAQDHISAQPEATSPCLGKQCLLHSTFPKLQLSACSQHLSSSPCFFSHASSCLSVPLSSLSQAIFHPLLSLSTPLTPESALPDSPLAPPSHLDLLGSPSPPWSWMKRWHLSPSFFMPKIRRNQSGKIRHIYSSVPASHGTKPSSKSEIVVYLQIWGLLKSCKSDSKLVLFLQKTGLCILMEYGTALCEAEMSGLLLAYQKSVLEVVPHNALWLAQEIRPAVFPSVSVIWMIWSIWKLCYFPLILPIDIANMEVCCCCSKPLTDLPGKVGCRVWVSKEKHLIPQQRAATWGAAWTNLFGNPQGECATLRTWIDMP